MTDNLLTRSYRAIESVRGPLVFVRGVKDAGLSELVELELEGGARRAGQIIELHEDLAVIQVFGGADKISPATTVVHLKEEGLTMDLSPLIVGRMFSGAGRPVDGGGPVAPLARRDVGGRAINPIRRDVPADFIQTGITAIDGMATLVRGQKLPVFSGAGLPANELAAHVITNARVLKEGEEFAIVFAGMGITAMEAEFFRNTFEESGAIAHSVVFMNRAEDPVVERLLAPRYALTAAEYLAFDLGMHVLVVLTDMTHYCNALREISSSREEIPGRRGYPGYMYTDLSTIYERAGRIKDLPGSVTQLPILTMPDDDITHPIPDLTGYITEGQIVLDRPLHRKGVFPPINVLPSLSRLMKLGIGAGKTREDHQEWSDQLYLCYSRGVEQRRVAAIIGEEGLSDMDKKYLQFAGRFEKTFIHQRDDNRPLEETLAIGWKLLAEMPAAELIRIRRAFIEKYRPKE
ncbi:MAG: V-type ATP synthase subunit B [Nitrospinae bacterium]|nr:V-type ATP synthase subunit B [Nitrospinota bacterium]